MTALMAESHKYLHFENSLMAKGHIVPEFYLKLFLDPNIPEGRSKEIWYYTKATKKWAHKGTKNVGFIDDYYVISDDDGNKIDLIEKKLAEIENLVSTIIKNKIHKRIPLTEEEKSLFSIFSMLMRTRVPSFINAMSGFSSNVLKQIIGAYHTNEKAFENIKAKFNLSEEYTQEFFNPDHWEFNTADMTKSFLLETIEAGANALLNMNWTFLYSKGNDYFVTSDNPYYLSNNPATPGQRTLGHLEQRNFVTLPLGIHTCFLATHQNLPYTLDVDSTIVKDVNLQTINQTEKQFYSPKKQFLGEDFLKK
ncbi:hypothetical protein CNR22_11400 [Sphingobacteriaceae bacterium]|nr:hypothetical protein CNR22_11400 [Sphingobacteriaceae bacterium]